MKTFSKYKNGLQMGRILYIVVGRDVRTRYHLKIVYLNI